LNPRDDRLISIPRLRDKAVFFRKEATKWRRQGHLIPLRHAEEMADAIERTLAMLDADAVEKAKVEC
jgi:hypothetical protein